ncbi:MAG TPA: hypothetical protein VIX59_06740 [Candidatus Binataceae bacterium]
MPSENVIHSIRQARETTAVERNSAMLELEPARQSLQAATENLKSAQSRRDNFIANERELARKYRELIDYCSSLANCPAALSAQIDKLAAERSTEYVRRKPMDQAVANCETVLAGRQQELKIAERNFQHLDQQVKELDIHMANLN